MEQTNILCPLCKCWVAKVLAVKIGREYFCSSCANQMKFVSADKITAGSKNLQSSHNPSSYPIPQNVNVTTNLDSGESSGQCSESGLNQVVGSSKKIKGVDKDE